MVFPAEFSGKILIRLIFSKQALPALLLIAFSTLGQADADLWVSMESSQIEGSTDIGTAFVEGPGEISLVASKNGNRLVVHARDSAGVVIGKAETVVGVGQTPIYVMTSDGLEKIMIYWGAN